MNRARRKAIAEIIPQLAALREALETIRDEETEAYENMPESIQSGERGDTAQGHIDNLDSAVSEIETIESNLQEMTGE